MSVADAAGASGWLGWGIGKSWTAPPLGPEMEETEAVSPFVMEGWLPVAAVVMLLPDWLCAVVAGVIGSQRPLMYTWPGSLKCILRTDSEKYVLALIKLYDYYEGGGHLSSYLYFSRRSVGIPKSTA